MTKKHPHRSRAQRSRHGRHLGLILLACLGLLFVFFVVDRSGPEESIPARVVETRTYVHNSGDRQGSHTHVEAVVEYEGRRRSLRPADRLTDGDRLPILIRRGRLTGYLYFVSASAVPTR